VSPEKLLIAATLLLSACAPTLKSTGLEGAGAVRLAPGTPVRIEFTSNIKDKRSYVLKEKLSLFEGDSPLFERVKEKSVAVVAADELRSCVGGEFEFRLRELGVPVDTTRAEAATGVRILIDSLYAFSDEQATSSVTTLAGYGTGGLGEEGAELTERFSAKLTVEESGVVKLAPFFLMEFEGGEMDNCRLFAEAIFNRSFPEK